MTTYTPNFQDYNNFNSIVSKLQIPSGPGLLSFTGNALRDSSYLTTNKMFYNENTAKSLKSHKIYKWLSKNTGYKKAFKSFMRTISFRNYIDGNAKLLGELSFMNTCSQCMIAYLTFKDTPPKVVTGAMKINALKPTKQLLKIINDGLGLEYYIDTHKLQSLLFELMFLIESDAPTLSARKNKGHLSERWLVQHIALSFRVAYGQYLPTVISHLLEAVDVNNISNSVLNDWITDVKDYWKHLERYEVAKALQDSTSKTRKN